MAQLQLYYADEREAPWESPSSTYNLFVPAHDYVFVTPQLITHYVDEHEYAPPVAFQAAVLACPPMGSAAYYDAMMRAAPSMMDLWFEQEEQFDTKMRALWQGASFLQYRPRLVGGTLQLVADWRDSIAHGRAHDQGLDYLCGRLDRLVRQSGADSLLPRASAANLDELASDLAPLLMILPTTDCWEVHHGTRAVLGEAPPAGCRGCPFVGPVEGFSRTDVPAWTGPEREYSAARC
jgi:hypothetical protein